MFEITSVTVSNTVTIVTCSVGSLPSRPNARLIRMPGSSTISTIRNTTQRQTTHKILNSVCLIAQAAAMMAPQGPPDAVPAATSATAFPPSTPALTVAAAALAVASAPFAAAFCTMDLVASLPAFAADFAALAAFCAAAP